MPLNVTYSGYSANVISATATSVTISQPSDYRHNSDRSAESPTILMLGDSVSSKIRGRKIFESPDLTHLRDKSNGHIDASQPLNLAGMGD